MEKKNVLIFIFLVLIILFICYIVFVLKDIKKTNSSQAINIDLQEFNLENREKLFINDELLIGENVKQLENGYYDFKLSSDDNVIMIALNKLWYDRYGADYIQDEYLAKISREIVRCMEIDCDKEELEYQLYKYIKENYLTVKKGANGSILELEQINIWSKSIANECVVYVKVG